jgi:5-methylcytosine-specific restriction protein A
MPIPPRTTIKSDLVDLLSSHHELYTKRVYDILAERYQLVEAERAKKRSGVPAFENEVRWARQELVDAGVMAREGPSGRGYWTLAERDWGTEGLDEEGEASGPTEMHREGHRTRVSVNRYERDRAARLKCLASHGTSCAVCSLRLSDVYGPVAEGRIHVHHLVPISSIGEEYNLDPVRDLRPVCPNCHFVMHLRKDPPYSIEELREMIEVQRGGESLPTAYV